MGYQVITEQVKEYVTAYYSSNNQQQLLFHTIDHTRAVVAAASQVARHYQLNEHDYFVVTAAAWFHDIGYSAIGSNKHEEKGASLAASFLAGKGVEESLVLQVNNCILATSMPQHPVTLVEQIVCDADLFHLGTDDFSNYNKQMRKEFEATTGSKMDKGEWRKSTIALFQSHHYHTSYCRELLNGKKQANLDRLLKKDNSISPPPLPGVPDHVAERVIDDAAPVSPIILPVEKPTRGIETMFRIAVTNHQRLSDMADSKANIMISVNAIIISLVIGLVVRKLETTPALIVPTLILLVGCVTAAIFSVLATRPKIPDGYFTREQLANKTVNLLFFGNFYKMEYEQYYEGMKQVMADSNFLYASLIRDIHSQGKILGNKYKLLRVSYTIFMFTLIIGIIAFAIAASFIM